jgi:hypothetical protein
MKKLILFLLFYIILGGCVNKVGTVSLGRVDSVPNINYDAYLYAGAPMDSFRAVFLRRPESKIEVVPFSVQISKTKGTLDDAMIFMSGRKFYRRVMVRSVSFNGELVGYLLTHPKHYGPYYIGSIEANIFERNGKVYFDVDENIHYGD